MPQRQRSLNRAEAISIGWFEHAIITATPKTGILDATSWGIWSLAEEAGVLAGEWKRHRILMQDLDVPLLSQTLGEMLAAIVRTAHAVELSLEDVMVQQVERVQTQPPKGGKRPRRRREERHLVPEAMR